MDAAREGPEHPLGRGPAATSPPFGHRSRGRGRQGRRGRYARPGLWGSKRPFRVADSNQPVRSPARPDATCAPQSHGRSGAIHHRAPTPCTASAGRGGTRWPGSGPARRPPPLGRRPSPAARPRSQSQPRQSTPLRLEGHFSAPSGCVFANWVRCPGPKGRRPRPLTESAPSWPAPQLPGAAAFGRNRPPMACLVRRWRAGAVACWRWRAGAMRHRPRHARRGRRARTGQGWPAAKAKAPAVA